MSHERSASQIISDWLTNDNLNTKAHLYWPFVRGILTDDWRLPPPRVNNVENASMSKHHHVNTTTISQILKTHMLLLPVKLW